MGGRRGTDWEREYAGYRAHTRARQTGTLVVLVDAAAAGVEDDPALPWALICVDHGGCVCFETQAPARSFMSVPREWCPTCQEEDPDRRDP